MNKTIEEMKEEELQFSQLERLAHRLRSIEMILIHMSNMASNTSDAQLQARDAIRKHLNDIRIDYKLSSCSITKLNKNICFACGRSKYSKKKTKKEQKLKKDSVLDLRRNMNMCPYCLSHYSTPMTLGSVCQNPECLGKVKMYFNRLTWYKS